jgi:hypothetical protein
MTSYPFDWPFYHESWATQAPSVRQGFREGRIKMITEPSKFRFSACRTCDQVNNDGLWTSVGIRPNINRCACECSNWEILNEPPVPLHKPLIDAFAELLEETA